MTDVKAAPQGPAAQWRTALGEGRLLLQRCTGCGRAVFEPRIFCPHCGAEDLTWVEASGKGVVYSTTTVRRKPEHGGDYGVTLIDLEEGARLMARPDDGALAATVIGAPVRLHVEQKAEGEAWIRFSVEGAA